MILAVYSGSFDPLIEGHVSVVRQAARLFDHVRVLVAHNPTKQGLPTGLLGAEPGTADVSSSTLKKLLAEGGDVARFVGPELAERLRRRVKR